MQKMNTKQFFFEESKKALTQYNFEKKKLAEAKKYSIPQSRLPSKQGDPIDRSLLLEWVWNADVDQMTK